MTTSLAPRTCTRCGRDYTVKPARPKYAAHRYGICPACRRPSKPDSRVDTRDYGRLPPISDAADDTRPVWSYRTPTGVVLLLPGDLDGLMRRLTHYWTNRLGMRMPIYLDLDDHMQPTGAGYVVGPDTGRIRARFRLERVKP